MKMNALAMARLSLALSATLAVGVAGCTDRNNNGQPGGISQTEVDKTVNKVERTAENAVTQAKPVVNNAVDSAETVTENAAITGKIKAAIISDADLKARNINVTTFSDKKSVLLLGTVQTAAQKSRAAKIAQQNAPGFKINNQLKVAAAVPDSGRTQAKPTTKKQQ